MSVSFDVTGMKSNDAKHKHAMLVKPTMRKESLFCGAD